MIACVLRTCSISFVKFMCLELFLEFPYPFDVCRVCSNILCFILIGNLRLLSFCFCQSCSRFVNIVGLFKELVILLMFSIVFFLILFLLLFLLITSFFLLWILLLFYILWWELSERFWNILFMVIFKSLAANSTIWIVYGAVSVDLLFYLTMDHIFLFFWFVCCLLLLLLLFCMSLSFYCILGMNDVL